METLGKVIVPMLLAQSLSITAEVAENQKLVTCTAGTFTVGENASVTCHFDEDVSKRSYHYYVEFFPSNSQQGHVSDAGVAQKRVKATDVLVCFRGSDNNLKCKVDVRFRFDGEISDHLRLEIPWVTTELDGLYTCQHVPPDGKIKNPCKLAVKGGASNGSESIDIVSVNNNDNTQHAQWTTIETLLQALTKIVIAILIVIIIVIVLAIPAALVWKFSHKFNCAHRRRSPRTSSAEGSAEESQFFTGFVEGLSTAASRALKKAGMISSFTLTLAEEQDIKDLELTAGDRIMLNYKVKALQNAAKDNALGLKHGKEKDIKDLELTASNRIVLINEVNAHQKAAKNDAFRTKEATEDDNRHADTLHQDYLDETSMPLLVKEKEDIVSPQGSKDDSVDVDAGCDKRYKDVQSHQEDPVAKPLDQHEQSEDVHGRQDTAL